MSTARISGKNNLHPIWFLERGLQRAAAVAHIAVLGRESATGMLIGPDVLLTNSHVLESEATASKAVVRLNYQDGIDGARVEPRQVECAPADGFFTSPYLADVVDTDHLDFTVVRLAESVGDEFGAIPLTPSSIEPGADVFIVQHPDGQKKQIAMSNNEVIFLDDSVCQYLADTRPGSSGAPVFDEFWNLLALHHAGDYSASPGGSTGRVTNEGVLLSAIRPMLPDWAV